MNQRLTSDSKLKKLGVSITAFAVSSFLLMCFVVLRLISLGLPLSAYFTSQGNIASPWLLDNLVAMNGLCGTFLIFEGILILLGKTHAAQVCLPFSFILIMLPYIIGVFPYISNIGVTVANVFSFPAMLIGIILFIVAARMLYKTKTNSALDLDR